MYSTLNDVTEIISAFIPIPMERQSEAKATVVKATRVVVGYHDNLANVTAVVLHKL